MSRSTSIYCRISGAKPVIYFERSFDYPLIRGIMTHEAIYRHLADDHSPSADQYQPIESEAVWYVLAFDSKELLGLWMLHPHNAICWEIHTCLLPHAWGARALEAAHLLPDWIWEHTPCRRLITNVPEYNRLAYRFALRSGMVEYGRNEASFLHEGRLYAQICLGISPQTKKNSEVKEVRIALKRGPELARSF